MIIIIIIVINIIVMMMMMVMIIIIIPRWLSFVSEEDCVLCDHLWILWWLFKPSLEAQSLEVVGHWNSVVLISAGDALWRLSSAAMTHCCV